MNLCKHYTGLRVMPMVVVAVCFFAAPSLAENFYWNAAGTGGWGDASRWFQGDSSTSASRAPAAGDTVNVAGCEAAVADSDQATINAIDGIVLSDAAASVAFENDNDFTLGCTVSGAGKLVKRGDGKLFLAALGKIKEGDGQSSNNCLFDHNPSLGICIERGWVVAPQSSGKGPHLCRNLEVQENGVFQMINDAKQVFGKVSGTGTITNATPTTSWQDIWFGRRYYTDKFDFAGKLVGTKWNASTWGRLRLTGTNSTISGNQIGCTFNDGALNKGIMSIMKFGKGDEPSSVGTVGRIVMTYSGRIEYLGTGEVTDKMFSYRAQRSSRNVFDAGAHGGLIISNAIEQVNASDCKAMARVELTGSNSVPCVIGGWRQNVAEKGTNYATYVTKTGKGTWRLADDQNNVYGARGAFAVSEGTLQYDSILETGVPSALGLSTVLYKDIGDVKRLDENKVDYAVLLGGPTTNVVFEHVGEWGCTTTRKIALTGTESRVRASAGSLSLLGGTYALDAGDKTLILDGTSDDASIGNISNGVGRVSVVKEGTGTWTLKRDLTFSGRLEVRGGTLVVSRAPEYYSWYRFTVLSSMANSYFGYLDEVSLYDEDGRMCCTNLTWRKPTEFNMNGATAQYCTNDVNHLALRPGEACIGRSAGSNKWYFYTDRMLENLFSANRSAWRVYIGMDPANPEKGYTPVVFRPHANAKRATAYDVRAYTGSETVRSFRMEASVDGMQWDNLAEVEASSVVDGMWYSDGSTEDFADHVPDVAAHPKFAINDAGKTYNSSMLSNVTAVVVSGGGTLRAEGDVMLPSSLVVDVTKGGGTIDGFAIPENGSLAVDGLSSFTTATTLPVRLVNAVSSKNINTWSVSVNVGGRTYTRARVHCGSDGTMSISPAGFIMVVW